MNRRDLDPTSSPQAAFGVQLRRSREARGMTQRALGRLINYSGTYVSYVERAERDPTRKFAMSADRELQTGGTLELMWWQCRYGQALIEGFPQFAAHEAEALEIRLFEVWLVPGLLQTRSYASALESALAKRGTITQAQADERLTFRQARQQLLSREAPRPVLYAVLDENVLHRMIGGPAVMSEQLRHLEHLAQQPNIVIQVAPVSLGERLPLTMPLTLLTLPDLTQLGYTETLGRGYLDREAETVMPWRRDYDQLQVESCSRAESLRLIRAARKELLNMSHDDGLAGASWYKSSYSSGGGQCIEVARGVDGFAPVRDSKDPHGPALLFPTDAFAAFVAAVKAGEFPTR
jgi:transcriptional regulator with XRE-family HTH domain